MGSIGLLLTLRLSSFLLLRRVRWRLSMPAVKKGESEQAYVSRCIAYVVRNEGLSQKAAAGKCYGMYKNHKHGSSMAKKLGGEK
jgi:hypothetical protein